MQHKRSAGDPEAIDEDDGTGTQDVIAGKKDSSKSRDREAAKLKNLHAGGIIKKIS